MRLSLAIKRFRLEVHHPVAYFEANIWRLSSIANKYIHLAQSVQLPFSALCSSALQFFYRPQSPNQVHKGLSNNCTTFTIGLTQHAVWENPPQCGVPSLEREVH